MGEVRFDREVGQCPRCRKTHAPLDHALGLGVGQKWTGGVRRKAALAGACNAYAPSSLLLRELAGIEISSSQVDRIVQQEGARAERREREREEHYREPVDPLKETPEPALRPERLVIEADATCVLTVPGEEHKSVYCATTFDLAARGRAGERAFIAERLYTASAESMEDFGGRLKALAWRSGLRTAGACAFLADGARCLWKWAEENLPAGTVLIQDFWHVCEHLADLAKALYGQECWTGSFERWKAMLRAGEIDDVLDELHRKLPRRRGGPREKLQSEITYLEAGRQRMDYARYEAAGWPIGSGAVEATCKHLVKQRLGATGAQWRRANIPQIAALRVVILNKEWEEFWETDEAA